MSDQFPASRTAPPIDPQSGIVYAATMEDRYVEEAFLSAESVKRRFPTLPITLFTDKPDHALCGLGNFDDVVTVEHSGSLRNPFVLAQIARLRALLGSPYKRTLHLDSDTRVLTEELPQLFALLDRHDVAMVETAVDDSYSRRQFGRRMFNSGVILFRESAQTKRWLEGWLSVSQRNFRIANAPFLREVEALKHVPEEGVRRRLLRMDQISLVETLTPEVNLYGLQVHTLDPSWNHRGSQLRENNRIPVKILHFPELRKLVHADIQAVAFAWKSAGRAQGADALNRYIASRYPGSRSGEHVP
jgi:hypothetical protein